MLTGRAVRIAAWLGFFGSLGALAVASCTDASDRPPADGDDSHPDTGSAGSSAGSGSGSTSGSVSSGSVSGALDAGPIIPLPDAAMPPAGSYCALPGSLVATANGRGIVPGANPALPDISWLAIPPGYCAHHFANVAETRQLRVSASGDVFAASPSAPTAGGEQKTGSAKLLVLPDDDHDGLADSQIAFMSNLPNTQGMTFANGYFYFQDGPSIKRVPYKAGDRSPSGAVETVTTITVTQSSDHWPKAVDVAQDGTVYVTNGSDQGETCYTSRPVVGAVFGVLPNGQPSMVSKGFRNPIALRCEADHDVCLVAELAKDGSGSEGGREKLVPVHAGDDWGFPCCATTSTPYADMEFQDNGQSVTPSDCAGVTPEQVSFQIGHTPFGLDFETGVLGAPWSHRAFVALHGYVGSYVGSRVVAISLDPLTGLPLMSSDIPGPSEQPNMMDFVAGWDDGHQDHGRATTVAFAPDGRLFVGDDTLGEIFWVAPATLMRP
jgi:glucose/arabinose dehydrogenase